MGDLLLLLKFIAQLHTRTRAPGSRNTGTMLTEAGRFRTDMPKQLQNLSLRPLDSIQKITCTQDCHTDSEIVMQQRVFMAVYLPI